MTPPDIHLHSGDLPEGTLFGKSVAVDCETMGLQVGRDRLCLVQLSAGDRVRDPLDVEGPDSLHDVLDHAQTPMAARIQ